MLPPWEWPVIRPKTELLNCTVQTMSSALSLLPNTFDKQLILRTPAESFFCFTVMALLRPSKFFPSPFPRDQPYFFNCVSAKLVSAIGSIAKVFSNSKKRKIWHQGILYHVCKNLSCTKNTKILIHMSFKLVPLSKIELLNIRIRNI